MNDTQNALLGIYLALCQGLSDEGVRLADDVLMGFANHPTTPEGEARIYREIVKSSRFEPSPPKSKQLSAADAAKH